MPRPNQPRSLGTERSVVQRIAMLCEERGWKYPELAERMTAAGCPIQTSALYKMEKGDPPRRVTLDEAAAFAEVFGITLDDIATPIQLIEQKAAADIASKMPAALLAYEKAVTDALQLYVGYGRLAARSPDLREFMDHQARTGWQALPSPTSVALGDAVADDDVAQFSAQVEVVWSMIVHLGRKSAGLKDQDL